MTYCTALIIHQTQITILSDTRQDISKTYAHQCTNPSGQSFVTCKAILTTRKLVTDSAPFIFLFSALSVHISSLPLPHGKSCTSGVGQKFVPTFLFPYYCLTLVVSFLPLKRYICSIPET